jgi:site-specific DNA-methyltransferase (adenine-specific)
MINLHKGDCLEVMDALIQQSVIVDAIITDPPYGTTACKWDSVIPFDAMWERLNKLIKPNGAIVLFGSEPFSSALRMSNIKHYKYDWIWAKNKATNFVHAKNKPMKKHEIISVFSLGTTIHKGQSKNRMTYNPLGLIEIKKTNKITNKITKCSDTCFASRPSHKNDFITTHTGYPNSILKIKEDAGQGRAHPTQKPVALMEYLIKTYTNEGETVLDFTMGSGTTGVACINIGRGFIGIERDEAYFEIAKQRIEHAENQYPLFKEAVSNG